MKMLQNGGGAESCPQFDAPAQRVNAAAGVNRTTHGNFTLTRASMKVAGYRPAQWLCALGVA